MGIRQKLRLTKTAIEGLPAPATGRDFYSDYDPPEVTSRTAVSGLLITVHPTGRKSFILRKKFNGEVKTITIGQHPSISVENARELARKYIQTMAEGKDPNSIKKAERTKGITVIKCFNDYLDNRNLSENTVSNYHTILNTHLKQWQHMPMSRITRDMVSRRHKELTKLSPSSANKTMRVLSALFNFGNGIYEDEDGNGLFPNNPVGRLSHTRSWNREPRRKNIINQNELKRWFAAVRSLEGEGLVDTVRDLLVFTLLTGLRRREATNLKWESVDFENRSFVVKETKNKQPLNLPMSDYVFELLSLRCDGHGEYVFPGGKEGKPIQEPKRQIEKIRLKSGVRFSMHDMRRTFITLAESQDISVFVLKALVNHKQNDNEVTSGYVRLDLERLRKPMQTIEDYILTCAGFTEGASMYSIEEGKDCIKIA